MPQGMQDRRVIVTRLGTVSAVNCSLKRPSCPIMAVTCARARLDDLAPMVRRFRLGATRPA